MNELGRAVSKASLMAPILISGQSPPPCTYKSCNSRMNSSGSLVTITGPISKKWWLIKFVLKVNKD